MSKFEQSTWASLSKFEQVWVSLSKFEQVLTSLNKHFKYNKKLVLVFWKSRLFSHFFWPNVENLNKTWNYIPVIQFRGCHIVVFTDISGCHVGLCNNWGNFAFQINWADHTATSIYCCNHWFLKKKSQRILKIWTEHFTRSHFMILQSREDLRKTPGAPFEWILWTTFLYNLTKFTPRSF